MLLFLKHNKENNMNKLLKLFLAITTLGTVDGVNYCHPEYPKK
jgi:hypothetical protein